MDPSGSASAKRGSVSPRLRGTTTRSASESSSATAPETKSSFGHVFDQHRSLVGVVVSLVNDPQLPASERDHVADAHIWNGVVRGINHASGEGVTCLDRGCGRGVAVRPQRAATSPARSADLLAEQLRDLSHFAGELAELRGRNLLRPVAQRLFGIRVRLDDDPVRPHCGARSGER